MRPQLLPTSRRSNIVLVFYIDVALEIIEHHQVDLGWLAGPLRGTLHLCSLAIW